MPVHGRLTITEKLAAQYLALGMATAEVVTSTGLAFTTIQRVSRDPLFVQEVDRCRARAFPMLTERLIKRVEELQEPALERMAELMRAESEPVQFQAAKDLLNRGPLAPKSPGYASPGEGGAVIHLDQQALQAILGGALNAGNTTIISAFTQLSGHQGTAPLPLSPQAMLSSQALNGSELSHPLQLIEEGQGGSFLPDKEGQDVLEEEEEGEPQ